jgi:hypothetical protein
MATALPTLAMSQPNLMGLATPIPDVDTEQILSNLSPNYLIMFNLYMTV